MRTFVLFTASAGYIGYVPVASGTFGSLVGIPIFFFFGGFLGWSIVGALVFYAVLVYGACWIAGKAEEILHEHDSHAIVIDEVVGYLAATLFLAPTWGHAIVAFFVFRVLDVLKPFPAGYIDANVRGGYGVVLDDVVSGFYANIGTRVLVGLWMAVAG